MTVTFSAEARAELAAIWRHNAAERGSAHADRYLAFLNERIRRLAETHALGRPVPGRRDLRYSIAKRRSGGHGHVVVYLEDRDRIVVLRVFHTSQNWPSHL